MNSTKEATQRNAANEYTWIGTVLSIVIVLIPGVILLFMGKNPKHVPDILQWILLGLMVIVIVHGFRFYKHWTYFAAIMAMCGLFMSALILYSTHIK